MTWPERQPEAGAAIRSFYKDEYTVRDKGEDNPLTDADLAADKILERHLRAAFPRVRLVERRDRRHP